MARRASEVDVNAVTRQRLLEAAGEVFAEHGYRNATVRDICKRAKANVAAVNYHFRDKETLYGEVLQLAHACARERYPEGFHEMPAAEPAEKLATIIHTFLRRLLDAGRPAWQGKLMARELIDPTPALNAIVDRNMREEYERLVAIVNEVTGGRLDATTARRSASSIIGQCLFYRHAAPVIRRLNPELKYDSGGIDRIAAHVTRFSLAALRELGGQR